MSELISNLNTIESVKLDIKSAIEAKGVDMTGMSFPDYPSAIGSITTSFVTETLSVSVNNTYYPGQGVDGFSMVVVDVPQSVTGFTEKDLTEKTYNIVNLNNSASFVGNTAFYAVSTIETITLNNCTEIGMSAFLNPTTADVGPMTVSVPVCTFINDSAFQSCKRLSQVYAPELKVIGANAFQSCYYLSEINFPECISIYTYAFGNCNFLENVSLPKCKTIRSRVFELCPTISQINLPECEEIGSQAFQSCSSLTEVSLPKCKIFPISAFKNCTQLSSIYMPNCMNILGSCFLNCQALSYIEIPWCSLIGSSAFQSCYNISSVNLGMCNKIEQSAFIYCSSLSTITMSETYVIPTLGTNAFRYTPITSGNASIYVDQAMYEKFIVATGWSVYASLFISIGNSDYMLSFSDGIVYGKTKGIESNFSVFLNIQKNTVTDVSLPNCSYLGQGTFRGCVGLTSINLPMCTYIDSAVFSQCANVSIYNLPVCSYIGYNAFRDGRYEGCTFILGASSVCQLYSKIDVFTNTTVTSIFVPASLVDAYKSDQNWSGFASRIFPIPEP